MFSRLERRHSAHSSSSRDSKGLCICCWALSVLIRRPAAAITATLGTCNVTSNNCVAENNTSQTCTALTCSAYTVGLHAYYYYPVGECDCHLRLSANSSRERVLLSINSKTNKITTENVIVNLNCFFFFLFTKSRSTENKTHISTVHVFQLHIY